MVVTSPRTVYQFAIRAQDRLVLWLVVGFAAVLQVRCALVWPTGYDEMWHVFEAAETPLTRFVRELSHDPHPPLHVILLAPLVRLGNSIFWPRLLSIVAALAHIPLMFLVARRLGVARPVAMLCALLVSLSYCHITLGVAVRSYTLATAFLMVGLLGLVSLLRPVSGERRRLHVVMVLLGSTLAMCTLYAAVLPVMAVGLALLGLGLARRVDLRGLLVQAWRVARWPELLASLGMFVAVVAYYLINRHRYPKPTYLAAHLLGEDESVLPFLGRNVMNVFSDFTPVGLVPGGLEPVVVFAAVLVMAWLGWRYLRQGVAADPSRGVVLVSLLLLFVILALLAIANLYAFGGRMRHQFVLFPFLHLALVMALDEAWRAWGTRLARAVLCTVVIGVAVWSLVVSLQGPTLDDFPKQSLWQTGVGQLQADLQNGDSLYLCDHEFYGVHGRLRELGYEWHHRPSGVDPVEVFEVEGAGKTFILLRDQGCWQLPWPPSAGAMKRIRDLMSARQLQHLWVFQQEQEGQPGPPPVEVRTAQLRRFCKQVGLELDSFWGSDKASLYVLRRPN